MLKKMSVKLHVTVLGCIVEVHAGGGKESLHKQYSALVEKGLLAGAGVPDPDQPRATDLDSLAGGSSKGLSTPPQR